MALQKFHKQSAKLLIWFGIILYFIGLVILLSDLGTGYEGENDELAGVIIGYFLTFGLGSLLFLLAIWRIRQANEIVPKPILAEKQQAFFSAKRLMFVTNKQLRNPYSFYALDGTEIATTREEITTTQQVFRLVLSIVYFAPLFPLVLYIHIGSRLLSIEKPSGFKKKYFIYDEDHHLLSTIEADNRNWKEHAYHIYNEKGEKIAYASGVGSYERYTIKGDALQELMSIQLGGIPREAMQLFGNVEADIVDVAREHVDEEMFLRIIAFPIIIRLNVWK